jgi:hypothetical protein
MSAIRRNIRSAILVLAVTAVTGISVSASDFAGRATREGLVVSPAVLPAAGSGLAATTVQFRRPLGYYDRWGHFHYYPWAYGAREQFRFRGWDRDDSRFRRDWDDRHRRDWDDRFRRR